MTTKTKKTKKINFVKLLSAVLVLLVLVYIGYQFVTVFYAPYKTQTARVFNVTDEIVARGVAVRDEITLSEYAGGAFVFLINDGDRIAKNETIACIYGSSDAVLVRTMLDRYERERAMLISLTNSEVQPVEFDGASARLYEAVRDYSRASNDNSLFEYEDALFGLTEKLGIYGLHVGSDANYSERIQQLNTEIERLKGMEQQPVSYIKAPQTGYFITNTDGFESAINKSDALELSVAELSALLEREVYSASGTKIVSDYEWYYVAILDSSNAARFTVGASLSLNFRYAGVTDIPATVVRVVVDPEINKTAVVFSCDYFNAATASLRLDSATISFRSYSGIKVDRSALRLENGVLGVYIKYGSSVRFRSVVSIYDAETYILASASSTVSGSLQLYDEIIVSGRDLYVGKQLN